MVKIIFLFLYGRANLNHAGQTLFFTKTGDSLDRKLSQQSPKWKLPPSRKLYFYRLWKNASYDFKILRSIIWPFLDQFVETILQSESPGNSEISQREVSGGIFLNPRLSTILIALTQVLLVKDNLKTSRVKVCETGFGAGHGIALYSAAATRALTGSRVLDVVSFDFYDRIYQPTTLNWLSMALYNTSNKELISVKGNTCETVPEFFNSQSVCGIVHGSSLCPSDNIDLVLFAAGCGTILTTSAMNHLWHTHVYFRNFTAKDDPLTFLPKENGQWLWLLRNGCIAEVRCYYDKPFELQGDLGFAISGTSHYQSFCIGLVTAECEGTDSFLASADEESWSQGYGRSITRNMKAREKCIKSPKYLKHSLLLAGLADEYQFFLIPLDKLS